MRHDSGPVPGATLKATSPSKGNHKMAKLFMMSTVQYRKWSPTANDPKTANDPQNGPQMILDRKWSPKSTANDPERKIGMTWTQVSGSSCRFYYYYNKSG